MSRKRLRRKAHRRAGKEADRAWDALEDGDVGLALKEIRRAVHEAGDSPAIWTDYGRILRIAGQLKESEKALRSAILIAPDYADAYADLAETLSGMGLTIQAHRMISRAVELKPQVPLYRELERKHRAALPPDHPDRE